MVGLDVGTPEQDEQAEHKYSVVNLLRAKIGKMQVFCLHWIILNFLLASSVNWWSALTFGLPCAAWLVTISFLIGTIIEAEGIIKSIIGSFIAGILCAYAASEATSSSEAIMGLTFGLVEGFIITSCFNRPNSFEIFGPYVIDSRVKYMSAYSAIFSTILLLIGLNASAIYTYGFRFHLKTIKSYSKEGLAASFIAVLLGFSAKLLHILYKATRKA